MYFFHPSIQPPKIFPLNYKFNYAPDVPQIFLNITHKTRPKDDSPLLRLTHFIRNLNVKFFLHFGGQYITQTHSDVVFFINSLLIIHINQFRNSYIENFLFVIFLCDLEENFTINRIQASRRLTLCMEFLKNQYLGLIFRQLNPVIFYGKILKWKKLKNLTYHTPVILNFIFK